ncbi:MAG: carboxypeptidase regulatory-like domain-containing protein, partial [Betaproteobacteria bacterium]|nr:carboxypeptidase regulatory-like domain-containing protein [Betaproteobacteria bacterium]
MSTMTIRVTSSAVNAAGTGLGQGPDLHAPSFYDAIITDSTNPNLPNGTYDAYCLHPLLTINFSPTLYDATSSDGENVADYIAADVAAITDTQIDQINWLLAQNFTADPIFAGQYNYGEVQAAIYELLGYTPAEYNIGITPDILSDNGRQTLERTDIDFLVAQAQAAIASGNNVVPTDAYFSALIDPEGNVQPLIVQLQSAKLGNFVWQDSNNNGLQDAGELGVNNVVVELYDNAGTLIATTTTGDDFSTAAVETGFYQFTGLQAGNYQVKFVPPANMALTVKDANSNSQDTFDSDAYTTTGLSDIISLAAGESNQTIDAGLVQPTPEPASISGFVYCDDNDDGVKDAGEAGLNGVTVQLLNAAGVVISTTTTGADGSYSFTGLDAGTYSVVEPNQPAGKNDGQETAGSTGGNTDVNDT